MLGIALEHFLRPSPALWEHGRNKRRLLGVELGPSETDAKVLTSNTSECNLICKVVVNGIS